MNIAILNAEANGNKGAEAMLTVLISNIQSNFENAIIYLETARVNQKDFKDFITQFDHNRIRSLRFNPKNILSPYENKLIKKMDFVIDIGGINFHDNASIKSSLRNFARFNPFIINNSKNEIILFTQDFGPSEKIFNRLVAKYLLNKVNSIFTRSAFSHKQVLNNYSIVPEKVHGPFPDSSLLLNSENDESLKVQQKYVVLCPSSIVFSKYEDDYFKYFVELYKHFNTDYQIVFLVNNFTKNKNYSDLTLCRNLHLACKDSVLIDKNIPASKLKYLLEKAVFAISSRYHVLVGSLSSNTPCLAVGWNAKYESFLKLYNKENWSLTFDSKILERTLEEINTIEKESLVKVNHRLKNEVQNSFALLNKILSK